MYKRCFILLSCLIDNLAAFTIIILKPFTLSTLKELLYHLLDLSAVAERSKAVRFLHAVYLI